MVKIPIDWRKPDGKLTRIQALWGTRIPNCLWFDLANLNWNAIAGDNVRLNRELFGEKGPNAYDLELGPRKIDGKERLVLRVRNPKHLLLELNLAGQSCPLFEVGLREDGRGYIPFAKPERTFQTWQPISSVIEKDGPLEAPAQDPYRRTTDGQAQTLPPRLPPMFSKWELAGGGIAVTILFVLLYVITH